MTSERSAGVTIRRCRPEDWPALERLFGPNGGSDGCWCMFWRVPCRRDYVYTGTPSMFRAAGFRVAQELSPGRPLMRRRLGRPRA